MSRKVLFTLIGAALALAGSNAAMACSKQAWSNGAASTATAGNPTDGDADGVVRRYSGLCGLRGTAPGQYVEDENPNNETSYRARFSVRPNSTGTAAVVFDALTGATSAARVSYDPGAGNFIIATAANSTTVPAVAGRWYSIALAYTSGGALNYSVKGNAIDLPVTGSVPGANGGIDTARLGYVSGGTAGTIEVDAFESRRTTDVPALCRGNANPADNARNSGDLIFIRNEFLNPLSAASLATGQPDCDENGAVNSGDLICIRNLFANANGPCPAN